MTNLTDYIEINHHLMTVKEMCEETGAKDHEIRGICKKNGWIPLAPVDRLKDYIKGHPGAIIEDIAEKFDTDAPYVRQRAREAGVELITRFQARKIAEPPKKSQPVQYSLMHRAFNGAEPEDIKEALDIISGDRPKPKVKRVKDKYNQSGSPYGLADKVWNKNLKL